jgi:biopolymer transport protein ExbD
MRVKKFDSINVVPFIDIMLVLLVIVLTTATFVAKGFIPVDLSSAQSSEKMEKNKELTITIKQNGSIYFDDKPVDKNDVETKLSEFKTNTSISLNCDKNAKFENFVYIIDILKNKEYKNLGIITKYE